MAHWPAMLPCCWNNEKKDQSKRAAESEVQQSTDAVTNDNKKPDKQQPSDADLNADW